MSKGVQDIVEVLRGILPEGRTYPLHEPIFTGNEKKYVDDCIDTGWVSYVGSYVTGFEEKLASAMGVKHAVATVNGTTALHVALMLCGVERDHEVLCPALTFIASANAISYCGAVPNFIEVSRDTLGVCPEKLDAYLSQIARKDSAGHVVNAQTGKRISALVLMHCFGHPVDMDACLQVAGKYDIPVIEDAAESLGSYYKGRHTGGDGKLSILSFNGNKVVTTGGGGAIATNDTALAQRAKFLTTTAKKPHAYLFLHEEVGYNYRLPNINAALGVAQLEQLPAFLARKRALAARYREGFKAIGNTAQFFNEPKDCESNYWLNAILVPDRATRDSLLEASNAIGIMTRPVWEPMHTLPMYKHCPRADLTLTAELADRIVNIPSSANL
ncbi:MAG: LegC family aminotransferase [Alphaproteobacteria bacterium]|nr:LegC family aminotransferase [Alphaproteobacteria bacterium]